MINKRKNKIELFFTFYSLIKFLFIVLYYYIYIYLKYLLLVLKMIECKEDYCCIIEDQLYLGNINIAQDEELLKKLGINMILNFCKDCPFYKDQSFFSVTHNYVEDKPSSNIEWGDKTSELIENGLKEGKKILVHCAAGISRSSSCILHFLMTKRNMPLKEAFDLVRSKRNIICPSAGFFRNLSEIDNKLFGKYSFTLEDYSIFVISETFPTISKEEIKGIYDKIKEEYKDKEAYEKEIKEEQIEPIGFKTYDALFEKYGEKLMTKRKRCSVHHPFD